MNDLPRGWLISFKNVNAAWTAPTRFWTGDGTVYYGQDEDGNPIAYPGINNVIDIGDVINQTGIGASPIVVEIPLTAEQDVSNVFNEFDIFDVEAHLVNLVWTHETDSEGNKIYSPEVESTEKFERRRTSRTTWEDGKLRIELGSVMDRLYNHDPIYWSNETWNTDFFCHKRPQALGPESSWPPYRGE